MIARYPEISPDQMTSDQRDVVDAIAAGPRGKVRGPYIALLHNAKLANKLQALGEHLRFDTGLAPALVEIAVLVTARRWTCQYEWVAHARIAHGAGLDEAIINAIAQERTPVDMSDDEASVHAFCLQVNERGAPDDATFDAAKARFGLPATLDLIALCGYYSLLAMVLNTADLPLPDGQEAPLAPRIAA